MPGFKEPEVFVVFESIADDVEPQGFDGDMCRSTDAVGAAGVEERPIAVAAEIELVFPGRARTHAVCESVVELAPHGIRVVSIHPTGVNTPMNDGLAALEGATPQEIAERSAGNLLPVPWIEPEDVAEAVLYPASDRARYVTGSEFVIDAGLLAQ